MPLGEQIDGYLDCRNAILRVAKLEALGATGVDSPTNTIKGNSCMIFDDMGSDMTNPPFTLGAASRDTSTPRITFTTSAGFAWTGVKLPNAWLGHFDLMFPDTSSTSKVKLQVYTESKSTYGNDGYEIEIAADGAVKVRYDNGSDLAAASASTAFSANSWRDVSVMFDRSTWLIAIDDEVVINFEDVERARVYANPTSGQFLRFETTVASARLRAIRFTNQVGGWVHHGEGIHGIQAGNVVIGAKTSDYRFDCRGTANVGALTSSALEVTGSGATTLGGTAAIGGVVTVSDATDATSASTGSIKTSGGLGVTKNIVVGSSGKLGVGINPESTAHVSGTGEAVLVTGDAATGVAVKAYASGSGDHAQITLAGARGTKASPAIVQSGDALATIDAKGYDGTAFRTAAKIEAAVDAAAGNGDVAGRIAISTTPDGSTTPVERLRIDSSGNVGVNTTSPSYLLDVHGSANVETLRASLPLATTASNVAVFDPATRELLDSNGMVSNKLSVVSEMPSEDLTAASSLVTNFGKFKVESATMATGSNAWNAFNSTASWHWKTASTYNGTDALYNGSTRITSSVEFGEYLVIEPTHASRLRYCELTPGATAASFPEDGFIYGSNSDAPSTDSAWTQIASWSGVVPSSTSDSKIVHAQASATYRKYALVARRAAGASAFVELGRWKLFVDSFAIDQGVVELPGTLERGFTEHPVTPFTGSTAYSSVVGTAGEFEPTTHFVEGHGTYEASASSSYNASGQAQRPVWHLFDRSSSTYFQMTSSTGVETYAASSPYAYNGSRNTTTVDVGGHRHVGVWVQLKVPRAFALAHTKLTNSSGWTDRAPSAGVLLGSNDGIAWYKLTEFSSLTYSSNEATVTVNATTPYQYFRMVVTNTVGAGSVNFTEWRLFAEKPVTKLENVHISGEISSETLQSGCIKWPRVPLLADSYEGYELSSSTNNNAGLSNEYFPWHAFNELPNYGSNWTPSWASLASTFTNGAANTSRTTGEDTFNHEWVQVKFPQAIRVSYLRMKGTTGSHSGGYTPKSGRVYASSDGITWTKVSTYSGLSYASGDDYATVKLESAASYDYWRVCFTENTGNSTIVQVDEIRFFEAATGVGAPPTSAKLQVHGSLGLAKGSSLYAGDSVVAEFPKHDRPLTKYPEVKMTAASTAGYTSSASGAPNSTYNHFHAFNNIVAEGGGSWHSGTTYATSGSRESTVSSLSSWVGGGGGHNGEWLKIQLPNTVVLKRVNFRKRVGAPAQHPRLFSIVGSNDDSHWHLVHEETSRTFTAATAPDPDHHIMSGPYASTAWKYFAVVIRTAATDNSYNHVAIGDWELYGTEEGDESVDVVHRSVPNKPSPQHLEVYWDANNSASYTLADNDTIYDLSGNGVNATISGGKGFNAKYNSWILNNNNVDYISATLTHGTGAWAHSVSTWVYRYPTSSTRQHIFFFGAASSNASSSARFEWTSSQWLIRHYFYNNDVLFYLPEIGKSFGNWLHIAVTYDGGSSAQGNGVVGVNRKLFVNGEECLVESTGGAIGALNLGTASSTFSLGHRPGYTNGSLIGETANARVFSKALSADQVKELYDYEAARFGHREDLVALHKGNLGIGLRDPEQRLVVAGSLQEFPPGPMTAEYTQFTGHGVFRATASSVYQGTSSMAAYAAFDQGTGSFWHSASTYSSGSGYNPHTGSQSITAGDGTSYSGEYIQLSMPYQIHLKRIGVSPRTTNYNRGPHTATLLARRNGIDWVVVASWGSLVWTATEASNGVIKYIEVNSEQLYSEFVMVVHLSNDSVNLNRIVFFGVPQMNVDDGRQLNVGQVMTGSVGIGTSAPHAPLTVYGSGGYTGGTNDNFRYFRWNADHTSTATSGEWKASNGGYISIWANKSIITQDYFVSHQGNLYASDQRIKENIADVNDSSALETFRLLQPKLYNYKDVVERGSLPVWGFIAQEVNQILKYSTDRRTGWIPNVYELANVHADGTVLEFDTTKLETGASKLRLYDQSNSEEDVDIDEIIDEYTVRLSKSIGNADQMFVYGQEINDFHFLNKNAVWTTAAAALQEIDRRQQADAAKIKALERSTRIIIQSPGAASNIEAFENLIVDANGALCAESESRVAFGIVAGRHDSDIFIARPGEIIEAWVTDETGDRTVSAGDLLATSAAAGYAKKQEDDAVGARTVAKVLESCDFSQPLVPEKVVKTETKSVTDYIKTIDVDQETYDALAEEDRELASETFYARDVVRQVTYNEYACKWPAYDFSNYRKERTTTIRNDVYEALPESERANYARAGDEWTYTQVTTIDNATYEALDEEEKETYVLTFYKNVTLETSEPTDGYEQRARPTYKKVIGVATTARDGFSTRTRDAVVPVLDANGQKQYIETSNAVPAYDIRHIAADGSIVTRHDATSRAAKLRVRIM